MSLHKTKKPHQWLNIGLVLWFGLLSVNFSGVASQPAQAASPATWVDSGLKLSGSIANLCVEATHPGVLLVNADTPGEENGLFAYNWQTHQRTKLSAQFLTVCTRNGLIYTAPYNNNNETYRLSLDDPQPRKLDHSPITTAQDGSLLTYSVGWVTPFSTEHNPLWVSQDGGLTWQERGQNLDGVLSDVKVSAASGRTIYALVRSARPDNEFQYTYTIYTSSDAGQAWVSRSSFKLYGGGVAGLYTLPGVTTPVDMLVLMTHRGFHENNDYQLSTDGGATFGPKFSECTYDCGGEAEYSKTIQPYFGYSYNQLLTFSVDLDKSSGQRVYSLKATPTALNTTDANPLLPPGVQDLKRASLEIFPDAPANLLLHGATSLHPNSPRPGWYSPDQGHTWQALPDGMSNYVVTPYLPLTLLGINSQGELFSLDLSQLGAKQTKPTIPNKAPNSNFYPDTGHNMSGLFKQYWADHGGLAQLGYPRTEAFREYNPADGKIYTVQYFERNRFEYHPEFKGTPYEVELGLLGNQLTEDRRANHDGAFNRFDDMHYPCGTYFAATGHNLRNSFKTYWEQHGGLAIYGYPISEEFYEKNPDDGQTYVVQYFERNRFEYHPEFRGTSYEVELGLLGNTLLKQKGWL